jgi:regulator of sirC expression with transglutaminase-like and TPR domain
VTPRADLRARLIRLGRLPDAEIDLAEAALVLASIDRPRVPVEPYRRHLARLAADVGAYVGDEDAPLGLRAEALGQVIAKRYGYVVDDAIEDVVEGANLMHVIDRRRGLAVGVGILYIHVAGALGWAIEGLDFPARFPVRLEDQGVRVILDPADGARIVGAAELRGLLKALVGNHAELDPARYRALGNRDVLLRLQNDIKVYLLRRERLDHALERVETALLFAPDAAMLWREAGLLHAHLDNVKAAVAALEEYMRRNSGDSARYRTSVLLQELRGRLG